jgi:hypothetical protein
MFATYWLPDPKPAECSACPILKFRIVILFSGSSQESVHM